MHIILLGVRECDIDDKREPRNVYTPRCQVCANQKAHITVLETLEILTTLLHRPDSEFRVQAFGVWGLELWN